MKQIIDGVDKSNLDTTKVPYTGATADVDLGAYDLTLTDIVLKTGTGGTKISGASANQVDVANVGGSANLTFKLNSVGASAVYNSNKVNTYFWNSGGYGLYIENTIVSLYSSTTVRVRGGGSKYANLVTTSLATTDKDFTFPNASGTIGTVVTKTDTGDGAGVEGIFQINTFDNTFKVYADSGWRTLATW